MTCFCDKNSNNFPSKQAHVRDLHPAVEALGPEVEVVQVCSSFTCRTILY